MQKLTAWSYSAYNTYQTCPRQLAYNKDKSLKKPKNVHLQRGIDVHKECEDYLKGILPEPSDSMAQLDRDFKKLKELEPLSEIQWAVDENWNETSWFDKSTWCRSIADAAYEVDDTTLTIIDFKTGKIRDSYVLQLDLMATVAMSIIDVEFVRPELWFLDQGEIRKGRGEGKVAVFSHKELGELREQWEERVEPMMNDTTFDPKPNFLCGWCDYSKDKGGPCQFGGGK